MRLTCLVDGSLTILDTTIGDGGAVLHRTTSDRTKLTATIEAATYNTSIHSDVGIVDVAVNHISATEGITCQLDSIRSLVVQFRYVFVCRNTCSRDVLVAITNITIVNRQIGSTKYGTTFTTTISVTLDSRNTIIEVSTIRLTDNHIGNSWDVILVRLGDR